VAQDWVSGAGLQTRDNVSAGATGNFSVTITRNSGRRQLRLLRGIVVAIAAAEDQARQEGPLTDSALLKEFSEFLLAEASRRALKDVADMLEAAPEEFKKTRDR
jgi:hypothetical protein